MRRYPAVTRANPTVGLPLRGELMATRVSTSSAATVFAQDPALLAALMLDQAGGNPSAVRSLAELCHQAGALDEARQLYERLVVVAPEDAKALAEILNRRRSPPPPAPDDAWPESKHVSSVLPQTQEYLRRVRPYVVGAVDDYDVARLFGIERSRLNRYELQVTCHGD